MMIGSDGGLVGPNPEGGPVVDRGCFGRWVSNRCCVLGGQSLGFWFWKSKRLDLKSPGLGSRKPQKPGPLGGVGVGCRLRRVIRFIGP